MERISDVISKKVVSIEEGVMLGYVMNVCLDPDQNKVSGYLICDDESEGVNFLDIKFLDKVDEYVMIKNSNMLSFGENVESNCPVGKEIITSEGFSLGFVIDAEIENKKIKKLITKKGEIIPKYICSWGEKCLIFSNKIKKKIKSKFPVEINLKNMQKVQIEADFNKNNKIKTVSYQIPFKSSLSPKSLIGRVITNDIFGFNNELIARKNEIINEKILKNAKKHNKEKNLIYNSK